MRKFGSGAVLGLAMLLPGQATSAEQQAAGSPPAVKREIIPGSALMAPAEREQYRKRMKEARSAQEQATLREDHVRQMQERARVRGLRLADPVAVRGAR